MINKIQIDDWTVIIGSGQIIHHCTPPYDARPTSSVKWICMWCGNNVPADIQAISALVEEQPLLLKDICQQGQTIYGMSKSTYRRVTST